MNHYKLFLIVSFIVPLCYASDDRTVVKSEDDATLLLQRSGADHDLRKDNSGNNKTSGTSAQVNDPAFGARKESIPTVGSEDDAVSEE